MTTVEWPTFRKFCTDYGVSIQCVDLISEYWLSAYRGPFNIECHIRKNTPDAIEFYTYYLPSSNSPIITEVKPTAPKNEYVPIDGGTTARKFTTTQSCSDITLTEKNGNTYTFSCPLVPAITNYVFGWDSSGYFQRFAVILVDGSTITLSGEPTEGSYKLSKSIEIDYVIPNTSANILSLWGMNINVTNPNQFDWSHFHTVNTEGTISTTYDLGWISQFISTQYISTPDNSAWDIPKLYTIRVSYYPTVSSATEITVQIDYNLTVRTS